MSTRPRDRMDRIIKILSQLGVGNLTKLEAATAIDDIKAEADPQFQGFQLTDPVHDPVDTTELILKVCAQNEAGRISDEALHAIIETLVFPSRYLGAPIPVAP